MARLRGLNKVYYNMNIESSSVDEREVHMLQSLRADSWTRRLQLVDDAESKGDFEKDHANTVKTLKQLSELTKLYKQQIITDVVISDDNQRVKNELVGK